MQKRFDKIMSFFFLQKAAGCLTTFLFFLLKINYSNDISMDFLIFNSILIFQLSSFVNWSNS